MMFSSNKLADLTALEIWAVSQTHHSRPIPDGLSLKPEVLSFITALRDIAPNWRTQAIAGAYGPVGLGKILALSEFAPMPANLKSAVAQQYLQPATVVGQQEKRPNYLILADDLKDLPTPVYGLEEYPIYMGCLNALVGPSGTGKSFVAVDLAGKLALQGAAVVYVAAEGVFGYSDRWEVWKSFHKIADSKFLHFYTRAVNMMDEQGVQNFMEDISKHKPQFLIIDTVARCMLGADENSTRDMGLFVSACDEIIHALGVGVLAIHHTGKDGKMRGSSALFGACDSVMFLQRSENSLTVFNSLDQGGKNKYSEEAKPKYLMFMKQHATVGTRSFESVVLMPAQQIDMNAKTDTLTTNQRLILEVLEGYRAGAKATQIQEMTQVPLASIYRQIATMKKYEWLDTDGDRYLITDAGVDALGN
jgi:archaellum biogenesis ATPase FlaH